MKKLLLHTTIILFLIVLLNQLAIRSSKVYKDGASIVCEEKRIAVRKKIWKASEDKINVLYFGASGILTALIPEVFDSVLNQQTYSMNLALPALPIGSYYHYFLDYLENNPAPEHIIMTYHVDDEPILLFNTYGNQGINFPREVVSYFLNRPDKNQIINYLLPFHVYWKSLFRYYYNSVFNPSHIEETSKRNELIVRDMIKERGYYFIMEQARFPDGRLPENYMEESDCPDCELKIFDPDTDVYVDRFFKLTKELNVEVLLISYPVRKGVYKQFETTPEPIRKLVDRYENISIPSDGWKLPFYPNKYFSDPVHLNKSGALLFTKDIAQEFNRIYLEREGDKYVGRHIQK